MGTWLAETPSKSYFLSVPLFCSSLRPESTRNLEHTVTYRKHIESFGCEAEWDLICGFWSWEEGTSYELVRLDTNTPKLVRLV